MREKLAALRVLEFDNADIEGVKFIRKNKQTDQVLANVKFLGQLILRSLFNTKIIVSAIQGPTNCVQADVLPEETMMECICKLPTNIGHLH